MDIYVVAIGVDILYRKLGNFRFEEVTRSVNLLPDGWGVGAVATDPYNRKYTQRLIIGFQ